MNHLRSHFSTTFGFALALAFFLSTQVTFAQEPTKEQKQRNEQKAAQSTTEQKQERSKQEATDAKEPTAEQQQKRAEQQKATSASTMSDADMKKTYDDRIKRYNENYENLSKRAAATNNPEMKKDITALQAQMNEAKTGMDNFMKNKDTMTPEQKDRAQASLRQQEEELKKKYEELKSKYASSGSGKSAADKERTTQKRAEAAPAETPKQ
ncbi:MAG: hypothetical protein IPO83_02955 [Chitinophagaceae bacterium]|nr:hypothetical protein [Chitinophagaceae bacterium]